MKSELDTWYENKDPWGYEKNPDDAFRKEVILSLVKDCKDALDIGAGEGFITKDLPVDKIYAIEESDVARSRLPKKIITKIPDKKFDLVLSSGTLYEQYDHKSIAKQIKKYAGKYVIIAGISDWLKPYSFGKVLYETFFPYREYRQKVTLYEVTS